MMNDDEIRTELQHLGIGEHNLGLVALLPIVHVAWADERVQKAERGLIEKIANRFQVDDPESMEILRGWMTRDPGFEHHDRALRLLRALAKREGAFGTRITPRSLQGILNLCEKVAEASGGVFGVAYAVDHRERDAIAQIAEGLILAEKKLPSRGWSTLLDELSTVDTSDD
jgi:hypothetical protein